MVGFSTIQILLCPGWPGYFGGTNYKPAMKKNFGILLCGLMLAGGNLFGQIKRGKPVKDEVVYHIFERSFYDSNGDQHGDLNGIRLKLGYLQQLGVTAILLTPLYQSVFYHNYYTSDFKKIDPKYGTLQDYLQLVRELHHRGMKFYMDMEVQYVTEDHIWWKSSYNNLHSKYRDYILYDDSAHTKPSKIVFGLDGLKGYDNVFRHITTVNLNSRGVQQYNYQLFKFWMAPNRDGKFDDGVDGFRLDHMMDNLDNSGRLPHLFKTFWTPLISKLRQINPKLTIIAEQADWPSLGLDYFSRADADRVFAFRLMKAIRSFDKAQLAVAADSVFGMTPAGKNQIVFIENHDMARFASVVKSDAGKLRVGAALNLLLGGIPSIYYGQELGMTGESINLGPTDANEVPNRQAFEWYKSDEGPGMAYWYKNSEVGRKVNNDIPNDGISLEEERDNPNSLWNYYRALIRLRKTTPVLVKGVYAPAENNNRKVFTFFRKTKGTRVLVAVNLSDAEQQAKIGVAGGEKIFGAGRLNGQSIALPAYGVGVWGLK